MKIVFVVPDMAGGGTERVISLLANEYVSRGIDTAILSFAGNQQAYPLDNRVELISAGGASGGSFKIRLERLKAMRRYFKDNKGCYIFSFSTIGTGFVVLSTLFMKRNMLVSERTDPRSCDHKTYRDFFYRFCSTLVCQTQDAVDSFPDYLKKKACVVGNPIDPAIPDIYEGIRRKAICAVGRLEPVKNFEMLIEAFSIFITVHPDYILEIYGRGSLEEELKRLVREKHLEKQVIFKGFCPNVKEKIRDASMFVLSSNYEGISNSMIEALAMGIPVISTDCPIGGSRTYIKSGKNGILVPVGNAKKMAKAMRDIIEEQEFSERCRKDAENIRYSCSIEKIADELLKIADKCI